MAAISPAAIYARLRRLATDVRVGREGVDLLRSEVARLSASMDRMTEEQRLLRDASEDLMQRWTQASIVWETRHDDVLTALKRVHADEASHRRQLRAIRTTAEYELAFTEPEPLVSVVVATYERLERLREKVIPSILAQQYPNVEIVIVGDDSAYGEKEVTADFGDAPIRFTNLPMRGPYPEDRQKLWMVAGSVPFNEAFHRARGRWLATFSDDDIMRPNHIRVLLECAREQRLEFVYGRIHDHHLDRPLGVFPPRWGEIALQASLVHSSLRFFEYELADADFNTPNDMGLVDRMLRAGVRCGMVDDVVADYFPSHRGHWAPSRAVAEAQRANDR